MAPMQAELQTKFVCVEVAVNVKGAVSVKVTVFEQFNISVTVTV